MRKSIIYFVLVIVYLSSCQKTTKNNVTENVKEIEFTSFHNIVGKEIILTTDIFFPKRMLLLSDTAIALIEKKNEYALRILKIGCDTICLTNKTGRIGQGPDDIASVLNNLQKDIYDSIEGIWMADVQAMKFHQYMANGGILEYKPVNVKKLPASVFPCSRSFILKNFDILGMTTAIANQIFIYSNENKALEEYNFYPVDTNPYDPLMSKTIYAAYLNLKPDKSHFVLAYQWLQSICIVSLDKLSKPLYFKLKDAIFPKFDITNQNANIEILRNLPLQYLDIYTTDNYIYALYAGKPANELENYSDKALSQALSIHVFNWDGTAQCSINLDRIINCFCVDEKNNAIYGINPSGEENSIFYRFDMPDLK
jgi:hypothetical protein